MSETVQIALITFLSGAIGSILGAIGSRSSAKISADSEVQKMVLDKYFSARLSAYQNVMSALNQFNADYKNSQTVTFLYQELAAASLVSTEKTIHAISAFQTACKKATENGSLKIDRNFIIKRDAMFECMRMDLISFSIPNLKYP